MADNDFKYVLRDFSSTQIGSRFTYEEMLMCDRVPFKLQSIIKLYILSKNSAKSTGLLKISNPSIKIGCILVN